MAKLLTWEDRHKKYQNLNYFLVTIDNIDPLYNSKDWFKENIKGDWAIVQGHYWYFSNEEDATIFFLKWS